MKIEFGTDGIRGVANSELTADVALLAGRCIAYQMSLTRPDAAGRIIVAKDTRISGDMLEGAVIAGICSVGVDCWRVGIAPTPALAYMTRTTGSDAGIMISASHNPIEDNGIKVFSSDGYKLDDETERAIEKLMHSPRRAKLPAPIGDEVGSVFDRRTLPARYTGFVRRILNNVKINGRVVIDCANGATARFAKSIFRDKIAEPIIINGDEDGRHINVDCGSTMPEKMARRVVRSGASLGFAFDGDGDRVIFADEHGNIVDGDQIMLLCADHLKKQNSLPHNVIVTTVMSNLGLENGLRRIGVRMTRTPVGDKFVLQEMLRGGYALGGEQSGHIIFLNHSTTGDGLITAAQVLKIFASGNKKFSDITSMRRSEQILKNIKVKNKKAFEGNRKIKGEIRRAEAGLGGKGRVLVRPSGTEPKIRVMVEAW
ncbi:MAG: phosphoglucosamine mutase, partial [bacterium]